MRKGEFRTNCYVYSLVSHRRPRDNVNCKLTHNTQVAIVGASRLVLQMAGVHVGIQKENSPYAFSRRALWSFMHSFNSSRAFAKSLSFCTWILFPGGCKARTDNAVNIHSVRLYYCMFRTEYNTIDVSGDNRSFSFYLVRWSEISLLRSQVARYRQRVFSVCVIFGMN